jgi:hypothetical protein
MNRLTRSARLYKIAGKVLLLALLVAPQLQAQSLSPADFSPAPRTINDLLADIGRVVPAFGGMFVDEPSDTLYAYLVPGEPGDKGRLDQAITEVLGGNRPSERKLEILQGRFTFVQLKEWLDAMTPRVLTISGVVSIGISNSSNRLVVETESWTAASAAEAELSLAGIPPSAFVVEEHAPESVVEKSPPHVPLPLSTLRDRWRPLVGGIKITIVVKGLATSFTCTLGFNAMRDKISGFVTNEHCLKDSAFLQGNIFYQPTEDTDNQVGAGEYNPKYFDHDQNKKCPEDKMCRFSDSTFVKLDKGVDATMGAIAAPALDSDQWDGKAKFRIVGLAMPMEGMKVQRVSQKTGRGEGKITAICQNTSPKGSSNIVLLCQTKVAWGRAVVSGDSGSPVFAIKEGNDVSLLGILWGDTYFSPIEEIKMNSELGPTLQVCAMDFKC